MIWLLLVWCALLTVFCVMLARDNKKTIDNVHEAAAVIGRGITEIRAAAHGIVEPENGKHKRFVDQLADDIETIREDSRVVYDSRQDDGPATVSTVETAEFTESHRYVYREGSHVLHHLRCRLAPKNYGTTMNPWAFNQAELRKWVADSGLPYRECGVCKPLTTEEYVS